MNSCQTESNFKFKWSEHTQVDSTCTCMCSCVNRMITVKPWMRWIFQLFPSQWLHLHGFQGKRHIQGRPERGIEGMRPHDPVSPGQARAFASLMVGLTAVGGWFLGARQTKQFGRTLIRPRPGGRKWVPVQSSSEVSMHLTAEASPIALCEAQAHRLGIALPGLWWLWSPE